MCAQRKLKSAYVSLQSDQSRRCPHEDIFASNAIRNARSEDSDQTARMRRLIWIFSWRTCPYVRFLPFRLIIVMQLLKCFMRQLWKYNHSLLEQIGRQGRNFNNNDIWESNLIFHASDSYSHYWQKKKIAKSLVIFLQMEFWFPVCIASQKQVMIQAAMNITWYMHRDGFVIIGVYADFNMQSVI